MHREVKELAQSCRAHRRLGFTTILPCAVGSQPSLGGTLVMNRRAVIIAYDVYSKGSTWQGC